ncbi:hypothetical protein HS7_12690 [Sulfolobales archaeon HS-7]|nr:hypothetical protein HS7_12690 [Sulfolobales archaeon HS-7]
MIVEKRYNNRKVRRGVEGIISTVLLILIVIVAAAFVAYYVAHLLTSNSAKASLSILNVNAIVLGGETEYIIVTVQNTGGIALSLTGNVFYSGSVNPVSNTSIGTLNPGDQMVVWFLVQQQGANIPSGSTVEIQISGTGTTASGTSQSTSISEHYTIY